MHQEEESPISKLLQMRRTQQPPPEYFENFLKEFQQRQRAELLRRPAWRIALERLSTRFEESYSAIFGPFSPSHLSYAGASLAVLAIAAVTTTNILQNPGGGPQIASNKQPAPSRAPAFTLQHSGYALSDNRVEPVHAFFSQGEPVLTDPFSNPQETRKTSQPRRQPYYILDARPATYEPPVSF